MRSATKKSEEQVMPRLSGLTIQSGSTIIARTIPLLRSNFRLSESCRRNERLLWSESCLFPCRNNVENLSESCRLLSELCRNLSELCPVGALSPYQTGSELDMKLLNRLQVDINRRKSPMLIELLQKICSRTSFGKQL